MMYLTNLIPVFQINGDYLKSELFFGFLFFALFIATRLGKLLHWSVGLAFFYFAASAIFVFTSPMGPFQVEFGHGMTAHMLNASTSFIVLLLLGVMIGLGNRRWVKKLTTAMGWGVLLNTLYVIAQWLYGNDSTYRGGMLCNASMNASFIACALPIFLENKKHSQLYDPRGILTVLRFALPAFAVWLSQSTMGTLTLAITIGVYTFLSLRSRARYALPVLLTVALCYTAQSGSGQAFWEDSGRYKVLKAAVADHVTRVDPTLGLLFGSGLGTMHFRLPWVLDQSGALAGQPTHWFFLHNDWAQLLLETGVIGLFLALLVYFIMLKRSYGRPWLFACVVGYGFFALGNWPLHLFMPALFGALLVRQTFHESA
jgi:hypothetical protein